jgi:predicted aldo/keto reductase-like oxidoreductase
MRCLSDPETAYQTIHRAVATGINHLETARGYGQSEAYLGLALQRGLSIAIVYYNQAVTDTRSSNHGTVD